MGKIKEVVGYTHRTEIGWRTSSVAIPELDEMYMMIRGAEYPNCPFGTFLIPVRRLSETEIEVQHQERKYNPYGKYEFMPDENAIKRGKGEPFKVKDYQVLARSVFPELFTAIRQAGGDPRGAYTPHELLSVYMEYIHFPDKIWFESKQSKLIKSRETKKSVSWEMSDIGDGYARVNLDKLALPKEWSGQLLHLARQMTEEVKDEGIVVDPEYNLALHCKVYSPPGTVWQRDKHVYIDPSKERPRLEFRLDTPEVKPEQVVERDRRMKEILCRVCGIEYLPA